MNLLILALILSVGAAYAQSRCAGLRPGQSTRADVERALGPEVGDSTYRGLTGTGPIQVTYDASNTVATVQVNLANPARRSEAISMMGLNQPTTSQLEPSGQFGEYFGPPAFVGLRYASADPASGVVAIQCFSQQTMPQHTTAPQETPQSGGRDSALTGPSSERAIVPGDAAAMINLGLTYEKRGGARNLELAKQQYNRAIELGSVPAMYRLGHLYEQAARAEPRLSLAPRPKNREQAIEWYERAAEKGDIDAMQALKQLRATRPYGLVK